MGFYSMCEEETRKHIMWFTWVLYNPLNNLEERQNKVWVSTFSPTSTETLDYVSMKNLPHLKKIKTLPVLLPVTVVNV